MWCFAGAGFTYIFKKDKEEKRGSFKEKSEKFCIEDTKLKNNIKLYCGVAFKFYR
jgi:hypothetical protein